MAIDKENFAVEIVDAVIKRITCKYSFFDNKGDWGSNISGDLLDDEKVELDKLVEKKLNEFELKNKNLKGTE